ncbi:hypothetical protein DRJ16_00525 [Candidatus Woesearchaeota archaeon]|nr:MAG: hypothetical protein DRJ16_00525 [Candidatus Woesearchaeota archaeon]
MLVGFQPRRYQEVIAETAKRYNTLVVLPTGLGKTAIALMLAANRLSVYPDGKVVFLAPTRPLIQQHYEYFKRHLALEDSAFALLTGSVLSAKRIKAFSEARVLFYTPQTLENDLMSGAINLKDVCLMIFDECHRAVGDYAYTFIAKEYVKQGRYPRIIGLTASPGSDAEKIKEVIKNLSIEEIEVRSVDDPDVKPYVKEIEVEWIKVNFPKPYKELQQLLKRFVSERLEKLKEWGIIRRKNLPKKELISLQANLMKRLSKGEQKGFLYSSVSLLSEIMKVQHAIELLETQGIFALHRYVSRLKEQEANSRNRALKNIFRDIYFKSAVVLIDRLYKEGWKHPKLLKALEVVQKELEERPDSKIIVFNQYRDNGIELVDELNKIDGVKAALFVGQLKKEGTGLSQKEQREVINKFREGAFNVLVATAVGEEGLDIPKVDVVVFYEPIPSAIRHIQRRGRTGRHEKGRVVVLVTKGTRDEGYRWSAHRKEKAMFSNLKRILLDLREKRKKGKEVQTKLSQFNEIKIIADDRERDRSVLRELFNFGVGIEQKRLECADYLLSSDVGVEVKSVSDFVQSIVDGRLFRQIRMMKERFNKPLLIIEGEESLFEQRGLHPNAINGAIASIVVDYGVPIVWTKNKLETAHLLYAIAKREQSNNKKAVNLHAKKPKELCSQQEYVVSALPGVGSSMAKDMLKRFRTIRAIVDASVEELMQVPRIGKKTAEKIRSLLDSEYVAGN